MRIPTSWCGCRHAGSYFVLSMLDRLWRPDLTLEEAQDLMERGIEEVPSCPASRGVFRTTFHQVSWCTNGIHHCACARAHLGPSTSLLAASIGCR